MQTQNNEIPQYVFDANMKVDKCAGLVINVPAFFQDPEFRAWLNNDIPKFTWHKGGEPHDWSDVVVLVDPGFEENSSGPGMPEAIWEQIVEACRQNIAPNTGHHIMIRLTNL